MEGEEKRYDNTDNRNRKTYSAKVLHKLGFKVQKEISYECSGGDMIVEGILCRYVV